MPELTREDLDVALRPLAADISAVKADLAAVKADISAAKEDLAAAKSDLGTLKNELTAVRIRVDGLPLMGAAIEALQRDSRLLRAAINDKAYTA